MPVFSRLYVSRIATKTYNDSNGVRGTLRIAGRPSSGKGCMKIDYIREYLVLVEEMNFTAAAKKLYLAQPALSRHIASLEDYLGTKLLERTTHSVSLTKAGTDIKPYFERIVRDFDEAVHHVSLLSDGYEDELNVGLLINSANLYAVAISQYMRDKFPKTRVRFAVVDANELFNGTISGSLDICLSLKCSFKGNASYLRYHKIRDCKLYAMVSQESKLAKRKSIPVKQLEKETLVFVDQNDSYPTDILALLESQGVKPRKVQSATETLSLAETVSRENACAIVVDEIGYARIPGCAIVPLEPELSIDLCWVYNALNLNPIVPQFIEDSASWAPMFE